MPASPELVIASVTQIGEQGTWDCGNTESGDAVMKHQISVIGGILSPGNLENTAREAEALTNRMNACRRDVDTLMHMHNGKHSPVEK